MGMDESTAKLLQECHSGCHMAIGSMEQILGLVYNRELKEAIRDCEKEHQALYRQAAEMLHEDGRTGKKPGNMASAMAWLSTEMKMLVDGSSHQAASIMTDGCNMGIKSISEYRNQYGDASAQSLKLADQIIASEESLMKELRRFM